MSNRFVIIFYNSFIIGLAKILSWAFFKGNITCHKEIYIDTNGIK